MKQIIAGNWKMNGSAASVGTYAAALAAAPDGPGLVVCPPFPLIAPFAQALAGSAVALGAQDCHQKQSGAHTGDVAAGLLRELGASHVILGHSERRADHGESDALVRAKTEAALAAGLIPIVCVGETEAERDAGRAEAVVVGQVAASLPDSFSGLVAYEPVWAIGTGRTPTNSDVIAMHAAIRAALARRFGAAGERINILYGGSVKPGNAAELLELPEVGGALVGGASLAAADFLAIAAAARAV
jgi:triosephosphate isomerase (TIM)